MINNLANTRISEIGRAAMKTSGCVAELLKY